MVNYRSRPDDTPDGRAGTAFSTSPEPDLLEVSSGDAVRVSDTSLTKPTQDVSQSNGGNRSSAPVSRAPVCEIPIES